MVSASTPPFETYLNNEPCPSLDFSPVLGAMRAFFRSGATSSYAARRSRLESLGTLVHDNETRIHEALAEDLGKPAFEAFASETGVVLSEVSYALKHLESWMEPQPVSTPLTLFPATSSVRPEPWGVTLIIAPWNYPFQLVMTPLVGALAAGNCALLKPSEWAPSTSALLAKMVPQYFPKELVSTVTGGAEAAEALVHQPFDYIFFTGGRGIGRKVAHAAAERLSPYTLELGGKSPAIVDEDVDLAVAARRITWGKFLNAGQTCIAPDYVLVPVRLEETFVDLVKENLRRFFGDEPKTSPDYARIINERHFDRLVSYLGEGHVAAGGDTDRAERYIAPTVLVGVPPEARVMEEEIFGPILPVLHYDRFDDAIEIVSRHPNPLALYLFTKNREREEKVLTEVPFGGGAVNDTLIQFSNPELPFGGRGTSGIGRYHGRYSFETFSHRKAIVEGRTWFDPPLRYPPYRGKLRWLKGLLR